jgi:protein ImuB
MSRAAGVAPRTLVVACPDWAVTALSSTGSAAVGGAVAVLGDDRIVAASRQARAEGVRPGQRSREAQACCPHLVVVRQDPGGEVRAFEPVVEVLETFGALVAVGEPGWAGFGVRGPARYFGGEAALVAAVDSALARLELPGRWWGTGLGDGPFVATQAASCHALVPSGKGAAFIAPLGVEVLGRPELADVLRRLGVATLGAFAALGESEVVARFGADGAKAHRVARGLDEEALRVRPRREDLSVSATLDPPAEGVEAMAFVAKGLAEQLAERLSSGGLACTRLRVEAVTSGGDRLSRVWSSEGAVQPVVVAERLRWQLEAWLLGRSDVHGGTGERGAGGAWETGEVRAGEGVDRVVLVPEEVVPDRGRQLDLWSRSRAGDERAARAVARVQGMLGAPAVVRAVLGGGRGPGERVRLLTFDDLDPGEGRGKPPTKARSSGSSRRSGSGGVEEVQAPWPGRLPAPSPAVVAGAPVLAGLLDGEGRPVAVDSRGAMSGAPATLALGKSVPALDNAAAFPVLSWAGPWPADERWWEGPARRRRVRLQVVTAAGGAYLLGLERGSWCVEAAYD